MTIYWDKECGVFTAIKRANRNRHLQKEIDTESRYVIILKDGEIIDPCGFDTEDYLRVLSGCSLEELLTLAGILFVKVVSNTPGVNPLTIQCNDVVYSDGKTYIVETVNDKDCICLNIDTNKSRVIEKDKLIIVGRFADNEFLESRKTGRVCGLSNGYGDTPIQAQSVMWLSDTGEICEGVICAGVENDGSITLVGTCGDICTGRLLVRRDSDGKGFILPMTNVYPITDQFKKKGM